MKKTVIFSAIMVLISLVVLELGLRAVHYQLNNSEFAIVKAVRALPSKFGAVTSAQLPLDMPQDVLLELQAIGGGIENANNPTHLTNETKLMTEPDPLVGTRLRKNVHVAQHMVISNRPGNIDPPIVAYDLSKTVPPKLKAWLDANTARYYSYTSNAEGDRVTLPVVHADKKVLMLGDSVAFGVGVDDNHTIASFLQSMLGNSQQVINHTTGGHGYQEIYTLAVNSSYAHKGNTLIYIACQNDFWDEHKGIDETQMREAFGKLAALKTSGHYAKVIIVLESYQQFSFHHFLNKWPEAYITHMRKTFDDFPAMAQEIGFVGINWDAIIHQYNKGSDSLFAGMSLYVDQVHLSPRGAKLMAEALLPYVRE